MRTTRRFTIADVADLKRKMLLWSQQYEEVVWLDSNDHKDKYSQFDAVLALDAFTAIQTDFDGAFQQLQEYQSRANDWIFGYLSYDLKNDIEDLTSENRDGLDFHDLYFFQPKKLFLLKENELEVQYLRLVDDEIDTDFEEIASEVISEEIFSEGTEKDVKNRIKERIPKPEYLRKVNQILEHIQRGDIYEANFCQEFFVENVIVNPLQIFDGLNVISSPPFASFLKLNKRFLLSASPERYLKKKNHTIISQPIKGTARRSEIPEEDRRIAEEMRNDPKEHSENIMIVDLVRNDLSRTAKKASVEVEELFELHSFKQVHQMVSTVKAELAEGIPPVEVLRTTFPMGSMTGAPKISAMKIIEAQEVTKRGLYSGAVGYFDPQGDFDFNVVIRSILYNDASGYLSFSVGSAITVQSNPAKEYEECLVKARAMRKVLEKPGVLKFGN